MLNQKAFMKATLGYALIGLLLLTVGIATAEIPYLVGNWTGTGVGYYKPEGFSDPEDNGLINATIDQQKGRIFTGNLTYTSNGTVKVEGFVGAVGVDNRTLFISEFEEGYDIGTMISENEMEMVYLADGENAVVAIDTLRRV